MLRNTIRLRDSVAATLIRKVFGIYFAVTVIITFIQLTNEYFHTKNNVRGEIVKMKQTFQGSLAKALWDFDNEQLHPIIFGMNEIATVVGVKINDSDGKEANSIGFILDDNEEQIFVASHGERVSSFTNISFEEMRGLFSYTFELKYYDPNFEKEIVTGKGTIYSSAEVVIDRIKYGFFLIVINSIIKTAALWFIIIYFVRRIIGAPLAVLTETTEKVNPNNPDFFNIKYSKEEEELIRSGNELGILARSLDKMKNAILERVDNLNRLRDMGEELASVREIPSVFGQIMGIMQEKFSFEQGALFLSENRKEFKVTACHPSMENSTAEPGTFRMGEGVMGKAAENQEFIYISDNFNNPDFIEESFLSGSLLCIPLTDENGVSGVMNFSGADEGFGLTDENRVFLEATSRLAMISIKNIRMLLMLEEHARLTQEMEIARHIQSVLLPGKPEISGYDIAANCDPAEEIGGDYYDVISVGGYDWIVVGDVSGHGLTAGLVMMMVQAAIRTVLINEPELSPSHLVAAVNRTIYGNLQKMNESKHMTIVVLAAGRDGLFSFAGMHEDMLIWRCATEKVEVVETDGMWIGLEPDISEMLWDNTLRLKPADCMVLYTDGIIEARNGTEMFGDKRLRNIVEKSGCSSACEIHTAILKELETYEKPDDATLFVMKRV